jgi:hypothetical protein
MKRVDGLELESPYSWYYFDPVGPPTVNRSVETVVVSYRQVDRKDTRTPKDGLARILLPNYFPVRCRNLIECDLHMLCRPMDLTRVTVLRLSQLCPDTKLRELLAYIQNVAQENEIDLPSSPKTLCIDSLHHY